MLPPVSVVSSVVAATPKQAVAVSAATAVLAGVGAPAVVLSNAANASVEGKLSIMLAALRDRMVQSLLDIMNAVGDALEMPQEPQEDNVTYALRIADAVQDLTPKQMASVQQQLSGPNQALPLQLIAQALKNPAGPATAQVIAYIETAGHTGRDLVTEAVIDSYSENEGAEKPAATAPPPSAATTGSHVPADAPEQAQTGARTTAQPAAAPRQTSQSSTVPAPPADARAITPAGAPAAKEAVTAVVTAVVPESIAPPDGADSAPTSPQAAMATIVEAMEVVVEQKPADAPDPQAISAAVPIALKQIAADVQQGLQIAIHFAIEAAGPEIVNMMAEGEQAVGAVIANALVADVLDAAELQQRVAAAAPDEQPAPIAVPHAQAQAAEQTDDSVSLLAGQNRAATDSVPSAAPNPTAAAAATPVPVPQTLAGIGYVIAPYPLSESPEEDSHEASVDRVDAIGEEPEGGSHGGQWQQDEEAEAEEQQQAQEGGNALAQNASEPAAAAQTAAPDAASAQGTATGAPAALPAPGTIALQMEAYGFYQRMAAE